MGETPLTAGLYSYHLKVLDWANHAAEVRAKLDSTTTKVEVRTCNDTGHAIKYVQVWSVPYADVNAELENHACTPYVESTSSRRASSASFSVGDDKFAIQPTDGYGDPLNPGRWSFHLTILNYANRSANVVGKQEPW
jgi:hypothetical protein